MGQNRRPVSCRLARRFGSRLPLFHLLPLSLFSVLKFLENRQSLLQSAQPDIERLLPFGFVGRQLRIKVFPIRRGRHGGAKNRLHQERMVWFEGIGVCRSEGCGELVRRVRQVVSEGLGCEIESAIKDLVRAIFTRNDGRHETYRTSQSKPSAAVCFLVLSSLTTRAWRFSDSEGVASWRSRTF